MGAAVVACCNPAPVLEAAERVFHPVPLAIEDLVVGQGCQSASKKDPLSASKRGSDSLSVQGW